MIISKSSAGKEDESMVGVMASSLSVDFGTYLLWECKIQCSKGNTEQSYIVTDNTENLGLLVKKKENLVPRKP